MGYFANPTHNAGEKIQVASGQDCCLVLNYNPSTSNTIYKVTSSSSDYNKVLWSDWNYVTDSGNEHLCPITYNSPSSKSSYTYPWGERGLTGDYLYHLDEVISRADLETYYDVLYLNFWEGCNFTTYNYNGILADIWYNYNSTYKTNAIKVSAKLRYYTEDNIHYGTDVTNNYSEILIKQYRDHSIDNISVSYTFKSNVYTYSSGYITHLLDAITYKLFMNASNDLKLYFAQNTGSNIFKLNVPTYIEYYGGNSSDYGLLVYNHMNGNQYGCAIVSVCVDSAYVYGAGCQNVGYNQTLSDSSSLYDTTYGGTHVMYSGNPRKTINLSVNGQSIAFIEHNLKLNVYLYSGSAINAHPLDTNYIVKITINKQNYSTYSFAKINVSY